MSHPSPGVTKRLCGAFCSVLSDRMKRLVLISSLVAKVKGQRELDPVTMSKLNKLMELCASENAMKLPVALAPTIWDESIDELSQQLVNPVQPDESRLRDMVQRVLVMIPSSLRYDANPILERDLKRLFSNFNTTLA